MSARLTRRQLLVLAVNGGAATVVLAACGSTSQPAAQVPTAAPPISPPVVGATVAPTAPPAATAPAVVQAAPTTIDFLAWGDNADTPGWEALVKAYAELYPNLTVNLTPVADPNANFYTKLQTAIAGGKPPHLASFQGWEWQTYADRGLLAPLDELIARDGLDGIYTQDVAAIKDTTTRNDVRYLLPLQLATMVMFYAKKPFEAAGLPFPTDDWTFEQFLETATKLTNVSAEVKQFGYQANGSWFRDIHWIRSTGKREFDSLIDPKQASFNQPEIVEIVQLVAQDLQYSLKISPTPADLQGGANTINTGNSALKYEGPWFLGQLNSPQLRAEGKQVDFDVVLMPQSQDPSRPHRGWSEGVAVLNTDRVEEAWGFASFAASEEGQRIYSEATGRLPNRLDLIEKLWLPRVQEQFQIANGQAFITALRNTQVDVIGKVPRSKLWSEVVKPVAYDPLLNNSAKAADVLPLVDAAVQKLLDEANRG